MNNQLCVVRQTLIDFNSDKLHYYPVINSKENCDGSYFTIEY